MANFSYDIKQDNSYNLGINMGYFAAFLIFASVFYFIMNFFDKIPETVKYYHVLSLVIVTYFIGFAAVKLKK